MCCRKARLRLTNLPGKMPGKRQAGWPLFGPRFSGHTEKGGSGAEGARKLFALIPRWRDADAMTSFAVVKLLLPSQE